MALDKVDEATTYGTWELGERDRVGEKGETPHGSVDEAAAARGLGTATTAEMTDGVSLATPASGPQQLVKLLLPSLIKPLPPLVKSNTPPKRIPPRTNESHGMGWAVAGRDDDDEVHQAHERADDPVNSMDTSTNETAASATASTSTDMTAPHRDHAKVTRDPGDQHRMTTQAKTPT